MFKKIQKEKVLALNKEHLLLLIDNEIKAHGNECDLNHINTSALVDMSRVFMNSGFNGDISGWETRYVFDMSEMFKGSSFNGDISYWDLSSVNNITSMFEGSYFSGDLSSWLVLDLRLRKDAFLNCSANPPYWFYIEGKDNLKIEAERYLSVLALKEKISLSQVEGAELMGGGQDGAGLRQREFKV